MLGPDLLLSPVIGTVHDRGNRDQGLGLHAPLILRRRTAGQFGLDLRQLTVLDVQLEAWHGLAIPHGLPVAIRVNDATALDFDREAHVDRLPAMKLMNGDHIDPVFQFVERKILHGRAGRRPTCVHVNVKNARLVAEIDMIPVRRMGM